MFNFLIYKKFRTKKWNKFSPKKRLKLLQKMENITARKIGRVVYRVEAHNFLDSTRGLCLFKDKMIFIDANFLRQDSLSFFALSTLFHEQRHAEQFETIASGKKIWKFSKKYKWKKNIESYISYDGKEKFSYYSMQSVERDANFSAIKRLRKLKFWFLNDKLYFHCLESKIKEYDLTKEYAKKELGPFYKLKLFLRSKRKKK